MLKLLLVRHGETDSNRKGTYLGWTDIELNHEGLRQAEAAADKLNGTTPDIIYCSPLTRTLDTARIISNKLKIPIELKDELKEQNFGIFENLTYADIMERNKQEFELWCSNPDYCMQDGESSIQVYSRVTGFIDKLVSEHSSGVVVLVTHVGCIRIILAHLLGMKREDCWRFRVDNGSISRIEINDEKYAYLSLLNG